MRLVLLLPPARLRAPGLLLPLARLRAPGRLELRSRRGRLELLGHPELRSRLGRHRFRRLVLWRPADQPPLALPELRSRLRAPGHLELQSRRAHRSDRADLECPAGRGVDVDLLLDRAGPYTAAPPTLGTCRPPPCTSAATLPSHIVPGADELPCLFDFAARLPACLPAGFSCTMGMTVRFYRVSKRKSCYGGASVGGDSSRMGTYSGGGGGGHPLHDIRSTPRASSPQTTRPGQGSRNTASSSPPARSVENKSRNGTTKADDAMRV